MLLPRPFGTPLALSQDVSRQPKGNRKLKACRQTRSQSQLGFRYRSPQGGVMKRNIFGALMTLIVACTIAVPAVHAQKMLTADVPLAFTVGFTQLPPGAYQGRQV